MMLSEYLKYVVACMRMRLDPASTARTAAAAGAGPVYNVEIIVFRAAGALGGAENWGAEAGARNINPILVDAGRCFGAKRLTLLRRVILPASIPYIITGMRIALGGAWRMIVAGEMLASETGIGSVLIRGFDPFNDTVEFGRELIPRLKVGAIDIDRLQAAG